jgi:phosphonate transport system permease protein
LAQLITVNPNLRDPEAPRRLGYVLLLLVLLWPLLQATEFKPWILWDAQAQSASWAFLKSFFPPEVSANFLRLLLAETWRTIAMATVGICLGWLLAVPLALACCEVLSLSALSGRMARLPRLVRSVLRALLSILRSVPELVWALAFVRVLGLGPGAGVLAIGLTYAGMLGKVYTEILESGETASATQLMRNGSSRLQAFLFALLPQNASELVSYTVYRWECAIRSSVVLGFVGAGGLGQMMDSSMKMFNGGEVSTVLLVFIALVALADGVSAGLRRALS